MSDEVERLVKFSIKEVKLYQKIASEKHGLVIDATREAIEHRARKFLKEGSE